MTRRPPPRPSHGNLAACWTLLMLAGGIGCAFALIGADTSDLACIALPSFAAVGVISALISIRRSPRFHKLKVELEPDDPFVERDREEW